MKGQRNVSGAAVAGLIVLVVAGCGSSSAGSAPAASTAAATGTGAAAAPSVDTVAAAGAAQPDPTCALAPASAVSAAVGDTLATPTEQLNGSVVVCTYSGPKVGTLIVRIQRGTDDAGFAVERKGFTASGQKTTDVPAFLDGAFTSSMTSFGITTTTLVARHGSTEVLVTGRSTVPAEKALILTLVARL